MNQKSKLRLLLTAAFFLTLAFNTAYVNAQTQLLSDSAYNTGAPNTGRIWGLAFGDYYYKAHSDSLNRGGKFQYAGIPTSRTAFQFRRIYLGYDYNISTHFSAELLLAMEDNFPAGNPPSSTAASGDLLSDGKIAPYIKYADLRWKNIWNGTDFVIGQQPTMVSAYSEKLWGYRSLERVMTDITGSTPTYDMGASLQGTFDPTTKNFGYHILVGNGNKAVPESDNFKWFYNEIWGKFFHQHLQVNLYADYERINWTPTWHHSRNMLRALVNYSSTWLTLGAEGYVNNLQHDNFATVKNSHAVDTLSVKATGLSFYAKGPIIPGKLGWVIRFDKFNPSTTINNTLYSKYTSTTTGYNDPTDKQSFFLAAIDWTAGKNVHFMPNVWYDHYATQLTGLTGAVNGDHDLVFRLTFQYTFGKN